MVPTYESEEVLLRLKQVISHVLVPMLKQVMSQVLVPMSTNQEVHVFVKIYVSIEDGLHFRATYKVVKNLSQIKSNILIKLICDI